MWQWAEFGTRNVAAMFFRMLLVSCDACFALEFYLSPTKASMFVVMAVVTRCDLIRDKSIALPKSGLPNPDPDAFKIH